MKFGEIIKRERLKKKWRQGDLGKLIRRSQTNISDIERNETPKFDIACLLCDVFDLNPADVWKQIKDDPVYIEKYKIQWEGDAERRANGRKREEGRDADTV